MCAARRSPPNALPEGRGSECASVLASRMSGSASAPDPRDQRLTSLEEHAAFTEHTVDQLSAEIAALNKRMHALAARIDSLDARLGKLLRSPESPNEDSSKESGE